MPVQVIEAEADSLEEAKKQLQALIPADCVMVSEKVLSDGKPQKMKAVGDTSEAAFVEARRKISKDVILVGEREVHKPNTIAFPIEAADEASALALAGRDLGNNASVKGIALVQEGKKGFLGIGRTLNRYEAQIFQSAVVEVLYRKEAKVRAEMLPVSELDQKAPEYLARKKDGKFDQVIAELTVFLPKLPEKSELRKILSSTYLDRGAAKCQMGNQGKAIADWESAVRVDPDNWKALVNLSSLYMSEQRWKEASQALEKAFSINPELNNNAGIVERLEEIRGHV